MSEVDLGSEEAFAGEDSPTMAISPEKNISIKESPIKDKVTPSPEKMTSRRTQSRDSSPAGKKAIPKSHSPDFIRRASVIPVRSFHSGDSKMSYYDIEDYQAIDAALKLEQEQQDEEDIYNWQNIINERLDRDSWTGGLGVYGKKKLFRQFTEPESKTKMEKQPTEQIYFSSFEGPSIKEPSTRSSKTSTASEYSVAMSYPETYLSESELAAKSEICQTFKERQNERTRRVALKMLDVTETLAPSKYVMPVYRSTKYSIPVSMHTFKLNRIRLHERMKCVEPRGFILLKGGDELNQYNTDTTYTFKQEPFFHWAFGVRQPSVWGGLCLKSGKSFLFLPKVSKTDSLWIGNDQTPEEAKKQYGVSRVLYKEQMDEYFSKCHPKKILLLSGINSDSGLELDPPILPFKTTIPIDTISLYPIMCELRVIKNNYEIELIRQACIVSSDAHKYVMHSMAGMIGYYEYQAESLFLHYCSYMGGCRTTSYSCVCGSGNNSSILRYGHPGRPNDKIINDGDLCLFDMGASYYGYASDVTCTFPANGKFTNDQKIVYNCVLAARNRAIEVIRPGIRWDEIHLEALRALLTGMKNEALLFGNVQEMIDAELGSVFMPHGLGHLLGIDAHDVGGYSPDAPPKPTRRCLQYLRTNRILSKNMVLTVEPGCYFIDQLLEEADESDNLAKFINFERINEFRGFGGVRIEDVVLVTEFGCEILSELPRTVEEIEAWMGSQVIEAGFDLGTELLPCLCAKIPPHLSQLRTQGGGIIKGICGCNESLSSSSGATMRQRKSICSEKDSVSELFESDHFVENEVEDEKSPETLVEMPDSEEEEIDEEEQKYLKTKLAFLYTDSSSVSSGDIKTKELEPHKFLSREFSREFSKLKSGVSIYQSLKKSPRAAPPTKPFLETLNESESRLKIIPKPPPTTPMSYLDKENEDLLIVHERKSS